MWKKLKTWTLKKLPSKEVFLEDFSGWKELIIHAFAILELILGLNVGAAFLFSWYIATKLWREKQIAKRYKILATDHMMTFHLMKELYGEIEVEKLITAIDEERKNAKP